MTLTVDSNECSNQDVADDQGQLVLLVRCTPPLACDPGLAFVSEAQQCQPCPRGHACTPADGAQPCPIGAYAPALGLSACLPCPPGVLTDAQGAVSFHECRGLSLVPLLLVPPAFAHNATVQEQRHLLARFYGVSTNAVFWLSP